MFFHKCGWKSLNNNASTPRDSVSYSIQWFMDIDRKIWHITIVLIRKWNRKWSFYLALGMNVYYRCAPVSCRFQKWKVTVFPPSPDCAAHAAKHGFFNQTVAIIFELKARKHRRIMTVCQRSDFIRNQGSAINLSRAGRPVAESASQSDSELGCSKVQRRPSISGPPIKYYIARQVHNDGLDVDGVWWMVAGWSRVGDSCVWPPYRQHKAIIGINQPLRLNHGEQLGL